MDDELTDRHYMYIVDTYPVLQHIDTCIREFRELFKHKSIPLLHLFIERYSASEVKEIKSFASGFARDGDAIENAVVYSYSNGFVEGTNNKLKMVKRTMYGRCNLPLLRAKMMLQK